MANEIIETRGDTIYRQINISVNGTAYTLQEGDTVYFTVKLGETKIIHKSLTLADLTDGKLILKLEPADTNSLAFTTYKYDVEIHFANGDVHTIIKDCNFIMTKEITTANDIVTGG